MQGSRKDENNLKIGLCEWHKEKYCTSDTKWSAAERIDPKKLIPKFVPVSVGDVMVSSEENSQAHTKVKST